MEGHVEHVSPTGALAVVAGVVVPIPRILGVHSPSRLGDTTHRDRKGLEWHGPGHRVAVDPDQLSLPI